MFWNPRVCVTRWSGSRRGPSRSSQRSSRVNRFGGGASPNNHIRCQCIISIYPKWSQIISNHPLNLYRSINHPKSSPKHRRHFFRRQESFLQFPGLPGSRSIEHFSPGAALHRLKRSTIDMRSSNCGICLLLSWDMLVFEKNPWVMIGELCKEPEFDSIDVDRI